MKNIKTTKSLVTLLLAASATSLTAIERPVPAEQPKEKKAQEVKPEAKKKAEKVAPMPQVKEAKLAQRPYLGVMGNRVSEAMSAQLNLEKNIGLTLQFVQEGSPADKAGLKKHDIITKIGGVNIGNQNQLREAILEHKPNEKVELQYLSGGKAITKQVELGAAPMMNLQDPRNHRGGAIMPKFNQQIPQGAIPLDMLKNLPPEQRKQLEQLLEGNLNQLDFRNLKGLDIDQLQKQFDGFKKGPMLEMKQGVQQQGRVKMVNPDGSVTLETNGDKKTIELHDADGKLQYKGPYNNEADKLKIPENLRERAAQLKLNDKPRALILPDLKQLEGLQGLEGLQNMEIPKELKDLLKNLEAQAGQGAQGQGFVLPPGGLPGNGQLMQKFEFNLGGAGVGGNSSSKSLIGPDGNRYTQSKNKDGKEIEIKDSKGKLLFSGPYNSSVDKEMVPEEYRPSLERLDAMGGMMKGNELKLELNPK